METLQFPDDLRECVYTLCLWWMSKYTIVNMNRFKPLAKGESQVYQKHREWVCYWWTSKSTTVNKNGFKPLANEGCQSLLQSTTIGLNSLLMVDVKSTRNIENGCRPFIMAGNVCMQLEYVS